MTTPHSVLVIGRCSVDIYPDQVGIRLEDVDRFRKFLGGSATNVAVACARYGNKVTVLTGVGNDPFGRFVIAELERCGVNASHVVTNPRFNTPVTFCEMFPPDHFPLYFYRQPTTPDLEISCAQLPAHSDQFELIWITASGLSQEPSRTMHHTLANLPKRGKIVMDLDYRERFWDDEASAREHITQMLEHIDVAIGNVQECAIAVGESDPHRAADALLERGVELAIVKQGPAGTLAKSRSECIFVPPTPVEVVNGLGAGDAFGGAVLHAMVNEWPLRRTIEFASAAGAIVTGQIETSPAMPNQAQVEAMLAKTRGDN